MFSYLTTTKVFLAIAGIIAFQFIAAEWSPLYSASVEVKEYLTGDCIEGQYDYLELCTEKPNLTRTVTFKHTNINTLIVHPGVEIVLDSESALVIENSFQALGTRDRPVVLSTRSSEYELRLEGEPQTNFDFEYVKFQDGIPTYIKAGEIVITNSVFGNAISFEGDVQLYENRFSGKVFITSWGQVDVRKCIFEAGLVVKGDVREGLLLNCTIAGSRSTGIELYRFREFRLSNNIIAFNNTGIQCHYDTAPILTYNDIYNNRANDYIGCSPCEGSFSDNPMFVDLRCKDFHLVGNSPCVDAGDPNSPRDSDSSRADIGALYYHHEIPHVSFNLIAPSNNDTLESNIVRFRWETVRLASAYRICITDNSTELSFLTPYSTLIVDFDTLGLPFYSDTRIEWWVEALTRNDTVECDERFCFYGQGSRLKTLTVPFEEGWNMISINVTPSQEFYREGEPYGPDVVLMTEQLRIDRNNHHIILLKNAYGQFYVPAWGFNNIPYWDLTQGYLVKVDEDVETDWSGTLILPDEDIPLGAGWNMIAYFPEYNLSAATPYFYVLSPIIEHVIIAKDVLGRFLSPQFNFSNMDPWRETQGYLVKVNDDIVLNYPEILGLEPVVEPEPEHSIGSHWRSLTATDENMSILVTSSSDYRLREDDWIAALASDREIVGTGKVTDDGRCGLAVWGDDPTTEEKDGLMDDSAFELRLWDVERELEFKLIVTSICEGSGLIYQSNDFLALEVKVGCVIPNEFSLSPAYPNPFNATTKLQYNLPVASQVKIIVYDLRGRMVETVVSDMHSAGSYNAAWDAHGITSGLYLISMETDDFKTVRKVILAR